jgi:hypothetical protein
LVEEEDEDPFFNDVLVLVNVEDVDLVTRPANFSFSKPVKPSPTFFFSKIGTDFRPTISFSFDEKDAANDP